MLERFALVVYWVMSGFAGICVLAAIAAPILSGEVNGWVMALFVVLGVILYTIGRAVRYVVLWK